ncbi:MAG TPA: hypothetical protein VMM13_17115 [Euzebya sp.]|nr:hypothetical protein [Euzebya sp.]
MSATLTVSDEALAELRPLFSQVEGSCEVWTDEEVVTRMLIRGVLAYGQTAGRPFSEMTELAANLRGAITTG